MSEYLRKFYQYSQDMVSLIAFGSGQGTGHCPAGIFKNIISNVTKNEEAGHGPVPVRG